MFKENKYPGKIGPSFNFGPVYALDSHPENVIAKIDTEELMNFFWLDVYAFGKYPRTVLKQLEKLELAPEITNEDTFLLSQGIPDFLGLNYYQTATVIKNTKSSIQLMGKINNSGEKGSGSYLEIPNISKFVKNPYLEQTNWDWTIDSVGIRTALRTIESRYQLPVLITENGLGEFDEVENGVIHDSYRIDYLQQHLIEIQKAITDGVQILGYCTWSFTDLLSWLNGYQKRYGFVYIDRNETEFEGSLNRYKKDSFYWYQEVIKTNGNKITKGSDI